MAGDTTLQALKRLTFLPDREESKNGNVIAGQEYYDVLFTGGEISNVSLSGITINSVDNITFDNGGSIRTGTTSGDTLLLNAYDVDGATYTTFGTLTAGNTPTFDLSASTTLAGGVIATSNNKLDFFSATTSAELASVISDETGTGALVFANTPTLVTPDVGVATATSVNKVAITEPATSATLTIQDGFTLTVSGNANVSGTNTGDQTITLTGDVTGTGTGSFATTIAAGAVDPAMLADDDFGDFSVSSGVATLDAGAISDKTSDTIVATDSTLFERAGTLYRDTIQGILDLIPSASTTVEGLAEIATQAEVNTGTDTTKYVTPETLANTTAVGGAWDKIFDQTASNDATIDLTSVMDSATYTAYILEVDKLNPATDEADLQVRISDDNGSTWFTSKCDSSTGTFSPGSGTSFTYTGASNQNEFQITDDGVDNSDANSGVSGLIWITGVRDASTINI
jgi:hypothetical protein